MVSLKSLLNPSIKSHSNLMAESWDLVTLTAEFSWYSIELQRLATIGK
jgi:hypothetical protein